MIVNAKKHYLAGIIDSRGTFAVRNIVRNNNVYFLYVFKLSSKNKDLIRTVRKIIQDEFGIKTILTYQNEQYSVWITDRNDLLKFCKGILSYLRVRVDEVKSFIDRIEDRIERMNKKRTQSILKRVSELIGKEVMIRVPAQYGKLSKEPRRCKIVNVEEAEYEEAGIQPEDYDYQPFFKVTFRICKGEKGAGRKFSYYYPLEQLKGWLK